MSLASGLQPERTALAWRRTVLAAFIGSVLAIRLLPAALGSAWWVLPGIVGALAAAGLLLASRRRERALVRWASRGGRGSLPGSGRFLGLLAAFSSLAALVGLVAVALRHLA